MPSFRVRLFGELSVVRGHEPLDGFPTRAAGELLAFVLLNRGRRVSREKLAAHLWDGRSDVQARKALRTGLWRVRTHLANGGEDARDEETILSDRDHVAISDPSHWWVDLWVFEDTVRRCCAEGPEGLTTASAEELRIALELHHRPFLENVHARWCEAQRDRARLLWFTGWETLLAWQRGQGQSARALLDAQVVLQATPMRERIHRELMALHYMRGDRPAALLQYERCRELLRDELGVSPMPQTRALRDRILAGEPLGDPHQGCPAS
jgi:DNA-binding SARP family transcriptional activator